MGDRSVGNIDNIIGEVLKTVNFPPLVVYSKDIPLSFNIDEAKLKVNKYFGRGKYEEAMTYADKGLWKIEAIKSGTAKGLYEYMTRFSEDGGYSMFYGINGDAYEVRLYGSDMLASIVITKNDREVDIRDNLGDNGKKLGESWDSALAYRPVVTMTMKTTVAKNMRTVEKVTRLLDDFLSVCAYEMNREYFNEAMSRLPDTEKEMSIRKVMMKNHTLDDQKWMSEHFPDISKRIAMDDFCKHDDGAGQ